MVDEPDRNVVGGFQRTLEALFELAGFAMVFVLPAPSQFPIQTIISYVMVFSAATLFSCWTIQLQQAARSRGETEVSALLSRRLLIAAAAAAAAQSLSCLRFSSCPPGSLELPSATDNARSERSLPTGASNCPPSEALCAGTLLCSSLLQTIA